MRVAAMLVGVLAFLAISAGCGGGDDSSLTKAEFVQQADLICETQDSKKNALLIKAYEQAGAENKEGKDAQEDIIIKVALPPISKMIEEIDGLGAPDGEEEKADAMVEAFQEEVENIESDPAGTVAGKVGSFAEADRIAKEFGMKACGAV